jgi:hypothetical protein
MKLQAGTSLERAYQFLKLRLEDNNHMQTQGNKPYASSEGVYVQKAGQRHGELKKSSSCILLSEGESRSKWISS